MSSPSKVFDKKVDLLPNTSIDKMIKKMRNKLCIMDASRGKVFIKNMPKGKNTAEEIEDYIQEVLGFSLGDVSWQAGDIEILCN